MPELTEPVDLRDHTSLRLGGPAARFIRAGTEEELIAAVRGADQPAQDGPAGQDGARVLVLGGGSNLVVADAGFAGTVIGVATAGLRVTEADAGTGTGGLPGDAVRVDVQAGESWDSLVDWAVAEKLSGLECLAGIPGRTGATPIQNVGAYGQEVATTIESVRVFDRAAAEVATLTAAQCGFGYRTSVFKRSDRRFADPTGRYVVLSVALRLDRSPMSAPVRYAELAARLGVSAGDRVPAGDVRAAVLELRRGKGMVLDPADPDTYSAGSFFTNPVLDDERFAELARLVAGRSGPETVVPRFPAGSGQVKVPAAWLIERSGFGRGYPGHGRARISAKHTLALTNRGGATTAELIALAREIATGVRAAFGVELATEPVLVGVSL